MPNQSKLKAYQWDNFTKRNTIKYQNKENRQWQIKPMQLDCKINVGESLIF